MSSRSFTADSLNPLNHQQSNKSSPSPCREEYLPYTSIPPALIRCSHYMLKKSGELSLMNPVRSFPISFNLTRKGRQIKEGILNMLGIQQTKKQKKTRTPSRLDKLPRDILDIVMNNLDHTSLLRMSEISSKFHHICRVEDRQWQRLFIRDFGKEKMSACKRGLACFELYRDHYALNLRMKSGKAKVTYLKGHQDTVYCVTNFNGRLISGGRDNSIKIWDMETGKCLETKARNQNPLEQGHQGSVLRLKAYSDKLISCSSDGAATVWSKEFKPIYHLTGHDGRVLDACQAGIYLVTSSSDMHIRIWDQSGKLVRKLPSGEKYINAMASHGSLIALASSNSTIRLYDVEKDKFLITIKDPSNIFTSVHFDGTNIYAAGSDSAVKVWEASTGSLLKSAVGHTDVVRALSVTGNKIVSGGYDQSIRIWDATSGQCMVVYKSESQSWVMCVFAHNERIFSAGHDGTITMLNYGYGLKAFS